ncbi:MAG: secretin N-terminal domain-containing protein [Thermodesulfobacteriota bacterium]
MKITDWIKVSLVVMAMMAATGREVHSQGKELTLPALEGVKSPEGGAIPKAKLFSLSVRDADLKEVLFAFSKDNGVNIIVDPDVFGKVTVDLKQVTMAAALEALLKPLDFDYRQEGNLIRVSRQKMETRSFVLNYITSIRKGSGSVSGIGGSSAAGPKAGGGSVLSQVATEDHADLWEEIKEGLKNIVTKKSGRRVLKREAEIGSKEPEKIGGEKGSATYVEEIEAEGDGKILINKMAGLVIVTDYPSRLREVEKFLAKVEETVLRQVFIEAKIIEVSLSDEFQLGVDWRLIPNIMNLGAGGFIRQSLTGTTEYPANTRFQVGLASGDFNALVDALSTQGKVEVLSSPRVSTLNNQKAIIKAAVEDVYFDVTIAAGTPPITTATPKYITIGVILDVTPQIDSNGMIIMDIHPSVTERIRTATFPDTGQQAPIISVRETQTIVRVREGQTILIAGLMQSKEKEELSGLPCIMNLPVAGEAFRQTRRNKSKSEIVILITPTLYSGRKIMDFTREGKKTIEEYRSLPAPGRHDLIR